MDKQKWNVLIVDDDEDDYLITRDMLREAHGARVQLEWAATYEAGQEAMNRDGYDAVLMDYDLGVHTGLELIREGVIQNRPYPIILLTGRGSHDVDVEAMQSGATMYITKNEVNALLLERIIRYAIEIKEKELALVRNAERQALLLEVSQEIMVSGPNRAAITHRVFEKVRAHLDADVFFNYLLEAPTGPLKLIASHGVPGDMQEAAKQLELGQAFCGLVAATRKPLAADAERINTDEHGAFVRAMGVRAYACHPLFTRDGRVVGTLSLCSTKRSAFSSEEISFLQTLCHFVALAWEYNSEHSAQPE